MLRRHPLNRLLEWKSSDERKPLLIRGARQVGKTTLVRDFAEHYINYLELNLERSAERALFETDEVDVILGSAFLQKKVTQKAGETLLFIDEIQESPEAIRLLRYFYEDRPDIHVIAAGSLLEFALDKVPSFPVGRIDYLYLHPLNFQEYLLGVDHEQALNALNEMPIKSYAHSVLMKQFNDYALIGGMPEALWNYIQKGDLVRLRKTYNKLWQSYKDDVEKYGKNTNLKSIIRHVIDSAPHETRRVTFQNFGNSNYRSREVGEALRALHLAQVIRLLYPTTGVKPPAPTDYRKKPRLQFLDTGMLNQILLLQSEILTIKDLSEVHAGFIVEHLVVQELISTYTETAYIPNFWVREKKDSQAEVDLVFQHNNYLIPIEIKSGKQGKLKSLHQFVDQAEHPYAIRVYGGKFCVEQHTTPMGKTPYLLMNLPYYLGTKIPQYVAYFVQNYSLK